MTCTITRDYAGVLRDIRKVRLVKVRLYSDGYDGPDYTGDTSTLWVPLTKVAARGVVTAARETEWPMCVEIYGDVLYLHPAINERVDHA